jgi:hypothetical protein
MRERRHKRRGWRESEGHSAECGLSLGFPASPATEDVLDHLLAPIYLRALYGVPATDLFAGALVTRLLKNQQSL